MIRELIRLEPDCLDAAPMALAAIFRSVAIKTLLRMEHALEAQDYGLQLNDERMFSSVANEGVLYSCAVNGRCDEEIVICISLNRLDA